MKAGQSENSDEKIENKQNKVDYNKYLPYLSSLILLIIIILVYFSLSSQLNQLSNKISGLHLSTNTSVSAQPKGISDPNINITSKLIRPNTSIPEDPIIKANQSFGSRLTNINQPFNSSELAIFNNANDSYFETAGEMILNGSFGSSIFGSAIGSNPEVVKLNHSIVVNGKPSVIYLGSITCIFCGENRWAMALALGRFGNFSNLFKGYSSFGDHDLPTLYWAPAHYNQSAEDLGNFYNSSYINFISIDDALPITGGFDLNPMSTIQSRINATGNKAYINAMGLILDLGNFEGTPYTIWGKYNTPGVDDADFGFGSAPNNDPPMEFMTHNEVFDNISRPTNEFGWLEYGGADLYIAMTCESLNNKAPICSLPVIPKLESYEGYN